PVPVRAPRSRRPARARRVRPVPARADRDRQLLRRAARHAVRPRPDRLRADRSLAAGIPPGPPQRDSTSAFAPPARRGAQGGRGPGWMRAAILHGPGDLRIEEVAEPVDEVVVEVEAATTCGTDVKMWRRGHPVLPPYPCAFGHETAGRRL